MRLIFGTIFILIVILLEVNVSKKTKGIGIVFQKEQDSIKHHKSLNSKILCPEKKL